jgi:hypothetical protein
LPPRRYNDLALDPYFAARYWRQRAGVFVQPLPLDQRMEATPIFLGGNNMAAELMPAGADLAFLPGPSAKEAAIMRRSNQDPKRGIAILHSAAGLLLCCRGCTPTVRYYVCNPVTQQYMALPKLPASFPR